MAEKMKIFTQGRTGSGIEKLEQEVNEWLSRNKSVSIVERKVVTAIGLSAIGETITSSTIVIFYK